MKTKTLFLIAVLSVSLFLIACPSNEGPNGGTAGASNEIPLGEFSSLTGTTATFGQSTHNGIVLALDEINAAGGVNGRKIHLYTEDDQSKPEEAASVVQKLISQNNVVAVLGEVASSRSLAAAPICQSNKVPMLSPSSTNPQVTQVGDYIFRACFIDSYQGDALARFVWNTLKLKKAAILTDVKNDYSVGLASFFKQSFTKLGGTIVAEQSYSEGDSDFKGQLTSIKGAKPDVLFIPGYYTEVGQIAIQSRDLGLNQPLVGGDGWESPKLTDIGGKSLNGSYYANHYSPDDPKPAVQKFVEKYKERFGAAPDSIAALSYDSTYMMIDAMKRAAKIDGPSIRDQLAATTGFQGVTGTVSFGPDRNPIKDLVIIAVKDGQKTKFLDMPPPGSESASAPAAGSSPAPMTGTATGTATGTGAAPMGSPQ